MKISIILNKLFIASVFVCFAISILRVGNNYLKIFTEEFYWLNLSDNQKRVRIFGDIYNYIQFVQNNTEEKSKIAFLSPGGKAFYLSRYYLYPRRVTYLKTQKDINNIIKSRDYDYLIMYKTDDKNLNENNSLFWKINSKPFAEYSTSNKTIQGVIYKL